VHGEYELPDAIDLLIQSGRTIDAVRMDGWRVDVGYPEDHDRAAELLKDADTEGDQLGGDVGVEAIGKD
jgi:glucose-1-phosphate thymidylyltransferase